MAESLTSASGHVTEIIMKLWGFWPRYTWWRSGCKTTGECLAQALAHGSRSLEAAEARDGALRYAGGLAACENGRLQR